MRRKEEKTSARAAAMRPVALGAALLLSACVTTQPPLAAKLPQEAAVAAPALGSYAAADGFVPVGKTEVRLRGKSYPEGFDQLRVVRRDHTGGAVAAQVAISVLASAVAGGTVVGAQSFSKDDLSGDPVTELAGQAWAGNPGMKELPEALGDIATRVYAARAWKELQRGRSETGWTREDMESTARMPAVADAPVNPGPWRLIYENLSGTDELYRLQFRAGLALASPRFGLPPMPANCFYQSEPVAWTAWKADNWQRLREERAKAVDQCVSTLAQTRADLW